ncbi:MAG: hypothetical protein ACW99U_07075 [Candidatus Thorarchaeota archaeon]|jgi:hypothetical protein
MTLDRDALGTLFGRVGVGNQTNLGIIGNNSDVSVGEIFMIYSNRDGRERVFFFRVLGLQNYLRRVDDISGIASTLMVEGDSYLSGIERNMLLSLDGRMLGYAEPGSGSLDHRVDCQTIWPTSIDLFPGRQTKQSA